MAPLTTSARKVLNMIVDELSRLPQGYQFWQGLPLKGRKSQRAVLRRWTALVTRELFPVQLRQAALLAALNNEGVPDNRSRALYSWLLAVVYRGQAGQLLQDWYSLKAALEKQPSLLSRPTPRRKVRRPENMPTKGLYTWHTYPPTKVS